MYPNYSRNVFGKTNETFSSIPDNVVTSAGFITSITDSTSLSGVDAPDVMPTLDTPFNHSNFILSGPFIKYAGIP
jgi:hypothetical protein